MTGRLRAILKIALRAPRRRLGAHALPDGAGPARPGAAPWAVAFAIHLLLITALAGTAAVVHGVHTDAVFTVVLRPPRAEAPRSEKAAEPVAPAFEPPASLPASPESGRSLRVGATGGFTFEDALAGRAGVDTVPHRTEPVPRLGLMNVGTLDRHRRFEERRRCGSIVEAELALDAALGWLRRRQRRDGAWAGPATPVGEAFAVTPAAGAEPGEPSAGLTALALLALVGADWGVDDHACLRSVAHAAGWLVRLQAPDGCLGPKLDGYLYAHGFATWALVEAAERVNVEEWRAAAQRAVWFIEDAQQPDGGFDYTERASGRADSCVSAVQVVALRAAVDAGLEVDPRAFEEARRFFDRVCRPDGTAHYAQGGPGWARATRGSTASAFLARLCLGDPIDDPWMQRAVVRIRDARSSWADLEAGKEEADTLYAWFVAAQGLIHAGPELWRSWNFHLQFELVAHQERTGADQGSWRPPDAWISLREGPVFATAIAALILETHARQAVGGRYAQPLRPVREAIADGCPASGLVDLLRRAVEDGDHTVVDVDPPADCPPLDLLEIAAAVRGCRRPGEPVPPLERGLRLRQAWRAALADARAEVRHRAAELTPALIQLPWYLDLVGIARAESDPRVRVALLAALESVPERSMVEPLLDALGDSDPRVVGAALRLARATAASDRLEPCLELTRSRHEEVCREATLTVLSWPTWGEKGVADRVPAWLQDSDPAVRKAAQDWVRARNLNLRSGAAAAAPREESR